MMALWCPKFLDSSTRTARGSRSTILRTAAAEPSGEPSSTKMTSNDGVIAEAAATVLDQNASTYASER